MNAIALLKADHRSVEEIFDKLVKLEGKSRGKRPLIERLVRELSVHASIEEQVFYPAVKKNLPDDKELVLECLEEHNIMKWELDALLSMKDDDERLDAKIKVLKDVVMHHIEEEENELFPHARKGFDVAKLNELGSMLEKAKKTAPTRPHPRAPDEPPGNIVMGMGAAMIDRARDAGRAMMRGRNGARRATNGSKRTTKRGAATKRAHARGAHAR